MKTKELKELKNKSREELLKELTSKREALRSFHFGASGSKSRNVREGRMLRRDIARILTVIGEGRHA